MQPGHFIKFHSQLPASFSLVDHFPFESEQPVGGLAAREWTCPRILVSLSSFTFQFSCFLLASASPSRWLGTLQFPASRSSSAALWSWGPCQAVPLF